jgi:sulfur-carrier protein adenylyltransferase/sulfurtransferase
MQGGIRAWKGLVAEGPPESGIAYFSSATKAEELIALAWWLEGGSRQFYSDLAAVMRDQEAKNLFSDLTSAEEHHQTSLLKLYQDLSGLTPESGFPGSVLSAEKEGEVMEGGIRVSEAIQWAKGKSVAEILEFSLSSEANSYDLYVKMEHQTKDQRSLQVFQLLSEEERQHLERLGALFEKRIQGS